MVTLLLHLRARRAQPLLKNLVRNGGVRRIIKRMKTSSQLSIVVIFCLLAAGCAGSRSVSTTSTTTDAYGCASAEEGRIAAARTKFSAVTEKLDSISDEVFSISQEANSESAARGALKVLSATYADAAASVSGYMCWPQQLSALVGNYRESATSYSEVLSIAGSLDGLSDKASSIISLTQTRFNTDEKALKSALGIRN